jgi:hypothetical protein
LAEDDSASARDWTDTLARIRIGTVRVAGKSVSGSAIKTVAERMARYGDADGSRVRPGIARLAVDLEMSYGTAKRAVQWLHGVGLLRLVQAASRPGHADVYQLALPVDLLERVEVWTPARHSLEVGRVREANRGRYGSVRRRGPDPDPDLLVPEGPADDETCGSSVDPQVENLRVPEGPAAARPAGPSGTDIGGPAGPSGTDLRVPQGPATNQGPRHITDQPSQLDVPTESALSARATPPQDQIPATGGTHLRLVTDPPLAPPPPRPPRPAHPFRRRDPAAEAIAEATARREARRQALAAQPAEETA